ncbi:ribonuclease H-like domain-containing protein [Tanacetum coccineum]
MRGPALLRNLRISMEYPSSLTLRKKTPMINYLRRNLVQDILRFPTPSFTKALDPDKDPLERCFVEYNWVFHKEIEQLADEYEIKDEEKTELGSEDYNPPMVHTETFEVTKYKFDNGCSFICVSGENNETLSVGRKNGSRFRKMIMEEMEEVLGNDKEDSDDETIQQLGGNYRDRLDSKLCGNLVESAAVTTIAEAAKGIAAWFPGTLRERFLLEEQLESTIGPTILLDSQESSSDVSYLLVYVDDIILVASSAALLQCIIALLHSEFTMTDLEENLKRAHMQNCNPCMTVLILSLSLVLIVNLPLTLLYIARSLVGVLQHLTFTRSYLSYVVQRVGCPVTYRSTFEYCVFLGDNFYHGLQSDMLPCLVLELRHNIVGLLMWLVLILLMRCFVNDKANALGGTHSKPVSFVTILNFEHVKKKVNFRLLENSKRIADSDLVFPMSTIEEAHNMYANSLYGYFVGTALCFQLGVIKSVHVWVKLHKVPIVPYSKDGLSLIATQIEPEVVAIDNQDDGFIKVTRKNNKRKKADKSLSRHIDGLKLNKPKPNQQEAIFSETSGGETSSGNGAINKHDGPNLSFMSNENKDASNSEVDKAYNETNIPITSATNSKWASTPVMDRLNSWCPNQGGAFTNVQAITFATV